MARMYSDEEKRFYLDKYKVSGKCKTEYARENDIPEATFRAWIKEENISDFGMLEMNTTTDVEKVVKTVKPTIFANAVWYSIIESAKANNLNINKYINYLLKELPQLENEQ